MTDRTVPIGPRPWSLSRRLLLLVVVGAVAPLTAVGVWTTVNAARSGEMLLSVQLDSTLASELRDLDKQWIDRQSDLMMLTENEPVRLALTDSLSAPRSTTPPPFVLTAFGATEGIEQVALRDRTGRLRWTVEQPRQTVPPGQLVEPRVTTVERTIDVTLPVTDLISGDTIGTLDAQLIASEFLPSLSLQQSVQGPLTAILSGTTPAAMPQGTDESVFQVDGEDRAGNRWISVRKHVDILNVDVVVAAMLQPYVTPFERSARIGALALFAAALLMVITVIVLIRRITGELDRVVLAAEAVSAGDLDLQLPVDSVDEVGRIATAFNTMTESLRRTTAELAQKEAMAAVGQFASELAHEIRNPLASIRLDLQRIEELAPDPEAVRGITPRLLQQVARLDRAVTGALRVSRGASAQVSAVDLVAVLQTSMRTAGPEHDARDARLTMDETPAGVLQLQGDGEALEQVFVNLLINAAHSLPTGGETRISVGLEGDMVAVTVTDNGSGMSKEQLSRLREPFRSSKRDGNGLGLKIARRLVEAHHGRLEIESVMGTGTKVRVLLPNLDGPSEQTE